MKIAKWVEQADGSFALDYRGPYIGPGLCSRWAVAHNVAR